MDPEFIFHPIVHVHTGHLFGIEARFSGCTGDDSETRTDLFDTAREKGLLHQVDLFLQQRILTRFLQFRKENRFRLFLRLDHRICLSPDYDLGSILSMIERLGLTPADICFVLHWTGTDPRDSGQPFQGMISDLTGFNCLTEQHRITCFFTGIFTVISGRIPKRSRSCPL
jgi:EAL domain-containing protein (putative c-di-GMP-specific phosphodiesterase class I)